MAEKPEDAIKALREAKNKEDLARQWLGTLQSWKSRRRPAGAPPGALDEEWKKKEAEWKKKEQDLDSKAASLDGRLREAQAKLGEAEGAAKAKEDEIVRLRQELAGQASTASRAEEQAVRLRQEFSAQIMRVQKELENQEREAAARIQESAGRTAKAESQLREKEALAFAAEARYQEAVGKIQALLNQLDEKGRELEGLSRALGRYERGENERNWVEQLHTLEKKNGELEAAASAKEKELEDFKQFLASRERELQQELERQSQEVGSSSKAKEDQIAEQHSRIQELESELTSFRHLLKREEERNRVQEAAIRELEESRQQLLNKLSSLGADIQEYQKKISKHLETAAVSQAPGPGLVEPRRSGPSFPYLAAASEFETEELLAAQDVEDFLTPGEERPEWEGDE